MAADMRRRRAGHRVPEALVFGASGQIGAALVARLLAAGWRVHAVSRQPRTSASNLQWLHGDFATMPAVPARVDAIASCGPLDHFAAWHAAARVETARVIAFGSTSLAVKHDSHDDHERALAHRLGAAEATLAASAEARGQSACVLRPTLVYGSGGDRTLTRIATIARRVGGFVLPADATGRRQPVHVDDLAAAAYAALSRSVAIRGSYDLPGGETLPYTTMVARVLGALDPARRLYTVPPAVFSLVLAGARAAGMLQGFSAAARVRMRADLVFDATPACRDLDYAPRLFRPTDAMFRAETSGRGSQYDQRRAR